MANYLNLTAGKPHHLQQPEQIYFSQTVLAVLMDGAKVG
jgi:hypothetical protein